MHNNVIVGVHSTQRSESIHAAVKNRQVSSNCLLVDLAKALINYGKSVELKNDTKVERDILTSMARAMNAASMAIVHELEQKVTPFAMKILKAQQSQMLAYDIAEAQTGIFIVKRRDMACTPIIALDGNVYDDHGLDSPSSAKKEHILPKIVTITSCTCQFQTCWGLPCRHMLRLHFQLQSPQFPNGVVKQRWLTLNSQKIVELKRQLMRSLPPEGGVVPNREMTRDERFGYLNSECKGIAEIAALTTEAMNILVKHLDQAKEEIG